MVPRLTDDTSCIAATSRAFGVRSGTMVGDARRLCPALHLVESRTRTYVEYHHRLIEAVESCVHVERTETGALSVLHRLLQKAAARMRGLHYAAGVLGLSLRYVGAGRWSDELRLDPTQDRLSLNAALQTLWDRRKHFAADPLAVGVTLS